MGISLSFWSGVFLLEHLVGVLWNQSFYVAGVLVSQLTNGSQSRGLAEGILVGTFGSC